MDWTQTLTIIFTIGASTAAVWYVVKEDIKLVREDIKRHDEEFSKVHTLWADLLKQIYEIKLDQSKKA